MIAKQNNLFENKKKKKISKCESNSHTIHYKEYIRLPLRKKERQPTRTIIS